MSLGITYEAAETDELGIKQTAEEMGIDLVYIPFRKIAICIENGGYLFKSKNKDFKEIIENVNVILNRIQSKNRRLYAGSILEAFGKYVLNPYSVESLCFSKFRTLIQFWKRGIKIPRTVYVPCDSYDSTKEGLKIRNEKEIADLTIDILGNKSIVVKPDGGTHGRGVKLINNRKGLMELVENSEPSLVNPVGFVSQEFVDKWFYDLRIIVAKERGKSAYSFPKALARAGFKDFRTNTYLGNMVFGVTLPSEIMRVAVKCGEVLGHENESWLLGLDAMLNIGNDRFVDDDYIKLELKKLAHSFGNVKKVKREKIKNTKFNEWNKKLEDTYQIYLNEEAYDKVRKIIEESIERRKNDAMFHEANSCPEFWEQTRLVAGINLAIPMIKCAESLSGWSTYQKIKTKEDE